ncbi:Cross-pathway control 1 [Paramyrothecium foliicola]|nr:Cross-pathway control 1 [Paramyrothecium foliicola]
MNWHPESVSSAPGQWRLLGLGSVYHLSVDLNFSTALNSFCSSSATTANISGLDFPVFTTDPQSTWLPNSPQNQPASSAQQNSPDNTQQDFVLFDAPQHRQPRPNQSPLQTSQRRHSSHHNHRQQPATSAVHNHRVAQILQAIGHPALSTVNANRITNNQFYASSAPSSTVALNKSSRPALPPVPLFNQSTGSVPQTAKMMNAADVDLDDFTAFEGGASTAFSSPAVPTVFDFPGSASSSISNLATVSPQDLLVQEPFLSAPNSAALTALTSPSIYDSPDFDGFNVSPNFGSADFDGSGDPWYPLFPQEASVPEQKSSIENSPAQKSDDADSVGHASAGSGRRKSVNSPTSGGRHSSVSGVNARKRDKPLPPIIIEDPNDVTAMKRARNTLAARKSRERKAQRFEDLEERIAKLEAERDHWKKIALSQSGAN